MRIDRFEDILAWKESRELNNILFRKFSLSKNYVFRDQLLRASLSIMNNIAEGFERDTDIDTRRFLFIAKASSGEVRSMLYLCLDFEYIQDSEFKILYNKTIKISKLLSGFIKKLS